MSPEQDIQTLTQWLTPGTWIGWTLHAMVLLGLIVLALQVRRYGRNVRFAVHVVQTQFEPASASDIDALLELTHEQGKKDFALAQMAEIRRLYGHQGLRRAHILWIAKVADGEMSLVSPPPAFDPSRVKSKPAPRD